MALIDKTDILQDIESVELESITGGDDTIIDTAIDDAETMSKNFIRHKYDVAILFAKVGGSRDSDLVMAVRSLALFNLSTRLSPNTIPENRMTNMESAKQFLGKVRTGFLNTTWDELVPDQGDQTIFGFNDKTGVIY